MEYDGDFEALLAFIDESNDSMRGIESDFIALENDPGNGEIINKIFRPIHSLKGNSGFFGLTNINKFAHRLENLLDATRKGEILVTREVIDVLLRGVEYLQAMLARAQGNPADIAYRPEETQFLTQLEGIKPQPAIGSIQSVIELENLLNEFLDIGLNIGEHHLVGGLLDHIAKTNSEVAKLIEAKKKPAGKNLYSPANAYFLKELDLSAPVGILGEVAELLLKKEAVGAPLLESFALALQDVTQALKDRKEIAGVLDELNSLRNFLDDAMMVGNDEYNATTLGLINAVVHCFEARPIHGGSQKIGEILIEQNLVSKDTVDSALAKQKKIGELLVEEGAIRTEDLQQALNLQDQRSLAAHLKKDKPAEIAKTIRIDQSRLDTFADSVGGLYIGLDSINYLKKKLAATNADFETISRFDTSINGLEQQLEKLHAGIMSIRRVPVKSLFQRFPKVIRQLSSSLGKDIRFSITGDDTVIDKDLLEKIENPLVHILRNSVDHGIELPGERKENNKPAQGTLDLQASADGNNVYIVIRDDGGGIDPRKVKDTAIKKEFLGRDEAERLSDGELINLIFKPGFSTATQVSDVSGRGVGMDVVMSGLKECNGAINVKSTVGVGTTVEITIPLTKTLVTKDAMIVVCDRQTYAIPTEDITTVAESDQVMPFLAKDCCFPYDGSILRVIDLNGFFYPAPETRVQKKGLQHFVICREHKVALAVDKITAHQKIVAKEFAGGYPRLRTVDGVSGYTILGNEDIILIVNVEDVAGKAA